MMRHYCTYFDHNYLPRALLLIESLRAQKADFRLHVVSLSDLCTRLLAQLDLPEIAVTEMAAIEQRYPELLTVKASRSPIEYIFTMTPFMTTFWLETVPGLAEITYLDSDLYFYGDPEAVFDHIGDSSIAIVPHSFSADHANDVIYGRFNVGWITYRATPEGLRCLADYRRDCLDWCHDRVEGDRYADQRYLDRWPERYSDLAIVTLKGANVAHYNVDNYRLEERDGRFWCDDEPLIFYHYHGVYLQDDGSFFVQFPARHVQLEAALVRRLYRPYLARLIQTTQSLCERFAEFAAARQVLRPREFCTSDPIASWTSDRLTRLRLRQALDVRRRLTKGDVDGSAQPFIALAPVLTGVAAPDGTVSLLDWGGGFGEIGRFARHFRPELHLDYHVLEVKAVCDYGRVVFDDTAFHDDGDEVFGRTYDVVLAAGALHYVEDWRTLVRRLAQAAGKALILLDVPTASGASDEPLAERSVREAPDAQFAIRLIDPSALRAVVVGTGIWQTAELPASNPQPMMAGALQVLHRSFVFRRPFAAGV